MHPSMVMSLPFDDIRTSGRTVRMIVVGSGHVEVGLSGSLARGIAAVMVVPKGDMRRNYDTVSCPVVVRY